MSRDMLGMMAVAAAVGFLLVSVATWGLDGSAIGACRRACRPYPMAMLDAAGQCFCAIDGGAP